MNNTRSYMIVVRALSHDEQRQLVTFLCQQGVPFTVDYEPRVQAVEYIPEPPTLPNPAVGQPFTRAPLRDIILQVAEITPKSVKRKDIMRAAAAATYSESSVQANITQLVADKTLKQLGRGEYQLVKKVSAATP